MARYLGREFINSERSADVRFGAHPGRKSDITRWSGQVGRGGGRTTDYLPRHETSRAIVPSIENIGLNPGDGVAMSRREFIDVLGGASIAWSLAFPDARGQELRKTYRVGFPAMSQLK